MGCITSSVENVIVGPVDLFFGNQHLVCVETLEGNGLEGLHFLVSSLTDDYYVWFDDGVAADPAVAGRAGIAVVIDKTETPAQMAVKIADAINAGTFGIHAKAQTGKGAVLVEVKGLGAPMAAFGAGDSLFTLEVVKAGSNLPIGLLDGNVELGISGQYFDVVAHQTGPEVRDRILLATEVGPITVTMKETFITKLKEIMEFIGQTFTPDGGTEEVTAIGALAGSKQFQNMNKFGKSLVMHPTSRELSDRTEDYFFPLSTPNLNNLTFSGEEDRKAEVEFSVYLDEIRVNQASKLIVGDWQQNFLKG
jgi:hypothetical protein